MATTSVNSDFKTAFIAGFERLSASADLLDNINVFPVADGDTGTNLKLSLACLRQLNGDRAGITHQLLLSARGNSGNIAARFLSGFLMADSFEGLIPSAKKGRDLAWKAVSNPQKGTMLSVFDALVETLEKEQLRDTAESIERTLISLKDTVKSTPRFLPRLKEAGVVDSGALGIFIYLEAFFYTLLDKSSDYTNIFEEFKGCLKIAPAFQEKNCKGYCIDMVLKADEQSREAINSLSKIGDDLVLIPEKNLLKVHLHTLNKEEVKKRSELLGEVIIWSDDNLGTQIKEFLHRDISQAIHIMTDCAGSVTRQDAKKLGITLLDSYINAEDKSLPESLYAPAELYNLMRNGVKVSTSQASVFERHQYYQRVLNQYDKVLYLCIGTFFTENYNVALQWKAGNDPENRLVLINTASASGRLGLIAIATARYSLAVSKAREPDAVLKFAEKAVKRCEEYVFVDTLKYLAAGGRVSKIGAFIGNTLKMKPVLSQTSEGIKKVGLVRNQEEQLKFAVDKLEQFASSKSAPLIMLEYTDNRQWVEGTVKKEIEKRYPPWEIILQPLSLTSGVHLGPGTWAIGILPGFG
jgi:DegV family protein with EDD domain